MICQYLEDRHPEPALYPLVRRTLLRIAADSGRFGIVPSESWGGGEDPWTAPTAWWAKVYGSVEAADHPATKKAPATRITAPPTPSPTPDP